MPRPIRRLVLLRAAGFDSLIRTLGLTCMEGNGVSVSVGVHEGMEVPVSVGVSLGK